MGTAYKNIVVEEQSEKHGHRIGLLKDRTGVPVFLLYLEEIKEPSFLEFYSSEDVLTRLQESKSTSDQKAWKALLSFFDAKGRHAHVAAFPFSTKKKVLPQLMGSNASIQKRTGLHVLKSYTDRADLVIVPQASLLLSSEDHVTFCRELCSVVAALEHYFVILDLPNDFEFSSPVLQKYVSPDAAIYTPWILMEDEAFPPGPVVAAAYQLNDQNFGIQQTPANQAIEGAIEPLLGFSPGELYSLLDKKLNVIQRFSQRGLCLWGGTSRAPRTEDNSLIATRRTLIAVRQALHELCEPFVLEPASSDLAKRIDVSLHSFFHSQSKLWDPNGKTPFSSNVEIHKENGTPRVLIQVSLALPYVMERVSLSLNLSEES